MSAVTRETPLTAPSLPAPAWRPLVGRPAMLLGVGIPAVGAVLYGVIGGHVVDPWLFVGLLVAVLTLTVVGVAARPWTPASPAADQTIHPLRVVATMAGMALAPPLLVLALDLDVQRFAPLYAIGLVGGIYSFPKSLRWPLSLWMLVMWLTTLGLAGVRDPGVLLLNLGGGLLLIGSTVHLADVLVGALDQAGVARTAAEQRATLLASLLRTNTLDPGDVFRAVTTGLMETGFDVAVIREIDHGSRLARLVDGVARTDLELPLELPIDEGFYARSVATGRPIVVADTSGEEPAPPNLTRARGWVLIPLLDDGEVTAIVSGARRDHPITDEQVAAAELLAAQAGEALLRARAYLADERTVAELRQLDLRTQDFVSTVSHELRTPLTVIQGLGQTLLGHWDELDADRRTDLLGRIDANAERLAGMVRSLLDTSAVEHGQLEPQPRDVALRPSVEALLHRLPGLTAEHPTQVRVDDDLVALVDPGLFAHVVENLLTNVGKHTPPGTRVEVTAIRRGERIEVAVADDGPGIADEDLPHVLDRFYRGGEPNRRSSSGLGLGLALAREIVAAHGGHLVVTSRLGQGTRFSFDVPASGPTRS